MVSAAVMVRNASSCAALHRAYGEPTAHATGGRAGRAAFLPGTGSGRPRSRPAKLAEAVGSGRIPLLVCLKQVSADETGIPQVRESENGQQIGRASCRERV